MIAQVVEHAVGVFRHEDRSFTSLELRATLKRILKRRS
jgi:hypothetical protein